MTTSDPSGILRFLTDELQDAEDAGERGYLAFHFTLSGFMLIRIATASVDHGSRFEWMGWH